MQADHHACVPLGYFSIALLQIPLICVATSVVQPSSFFHGVPLPCSHISFFCSHHACQTHADEHPCQGSGHTALPAGFPLCLAPTSDFFCFYRVCQTQVCITTKDRGALNCRLASPTQPPRKVLLPP
eukprot:scaffold308624_cov15-Tisochrysis_lutea.AAC.2